METTEIYKKTDRIIESTQMLADRYLGIVRKYDLALFAVEQDRIEKEVRTLLNIEKPRVMLAGVYNAGKSTLVNALLGREAAEVADRPKTYKITEYDNGDYTIVDTPGVDAPIEHEKITHESIKNSHAVFFVISANGTFESETNYKEMLSLIKSGKQLQIVLNDKNGEHETPNHPEVELIKRKIMNNLVSYSGNSSIANNYEVLFVNAKRALNGKLKKNDIFIEKSNLRSIENTINRLLKDENAHQMLNAPVNNLRDIINGFQRLLMNRNSAVKQYERELAELERKRDIIITDIEHVAKQIIIDREDVLVEQMLNGSVDVSAVAEQIDKSISDYLKAKGKETTAFLGTAFSAVYSKNNSAKDLKVGMADTSSLSASLHNYSSTNMVDTQLEAPDLVLQRSEETNASKETFGSAMKIIVPAIVTTINLPVGLVTAAVTLLGSLLFGDQRKKEDEILREVELANKRAKYEANEKMRIRQEARTRVKYALSEMFLAYTQAARNSVNSYFAEITDKVHKLIAKNQEEYDFISGIQKDIDAVKFELDDIASRI